MATEMGYRGPTAMKAAGISYRQLDYWARTDLVKPSIQDAKGSGSQRMYSFGDIVQLKVIKNLLDAGVTLPKIRKAVDYLRTELKRPLQDVMLVSDGRSIHACISPTEVVDLLAGGQGVFAIAVGKVYEELQGNITELRPADKTPGEGAGDDLEAHGS